MVKKFKYQRKTKFRPFKKINVRLIDKDIKEYLDFFIKNYFYFFEELKNKQDVLLVLKNFCKELGVQLFLRKEIKNFSGFFDIDTNRIDLKTKHRKEYILCVFFHELAHWIQYKLKKFPKIITKLSEELRLEQQAQSIAFYFYKNLFDKKATQYKIKFFSMYFEQKDFKWLYKTLYKYYNKQNILFENDLF